MKLHVLDRSTSENQSFSVSFNSYPNFLKIWHAHSEFELAVILESYGSCFVGDSITPFVPGTVVLIGKNLPHMWLNDDVFFQSDVNLKAEAIAVHFKDYFLGKEFWQLPEMTQIGVLLARSQQGVMFRNLDDEFMQKVKLLLEKKGIERVILFLALLDKLSHHSDFKLLASKSYQGKETNHLASMVVTLHQCTRRGVYMTLYSNIIVSCLTQLEGFETKMTIVLLK